MDNPYFRIETGRMGKLDHLYLPQGLSPNYQLYLTERMDSTIQSQKPSLSELDLRVSAKALPIIHLAGLLYANNHTSSKEVSPPSIKEVD